MVSSLSRAYCVMRNLTQEEDSHALSPDSCVCLHALPHENLPQLSSKTSSLLFFVDRARELRRVPGL